MGRRLILTEAMRKKLESISNGLGGLESRGGVSKSTRALERRRLITPGGRGHGYVLTESGLDALQAELDKHNH